MLPWVLLAQSGAAAALFGWFLGEPAPLLLVAYAALTIGSLLVGQKTKAAEQAHALMIRHPAFGIGVLFALGAVAYPPLVVVAFALLDWIYVRAGQEVPLS